MKKERKQKLEEKLVKKLSKLCDDTSLASDYLDKAIIFFKNSCNRFDVPENADFLIFDIAFSFIQNDGLIKKDEEMKEISRGDTKIVYKDNSKKISLDSSFEKRLIRFRKLGLLRKE